MAKRNLKLKTASKEKVESKTVAAPKQKAITQGVVKHDIQSSYSGMSPLYNSRKSNTRVQVETFNTLLDAPMTERVNALLKDLVRTYGNKTFERGNIGAGALKRLGQRGYIEHVEGDPISATCKFKLTKKALA